ncbi:MAG: hypothetical protein IJH65_05440 [Methanobrevibacter sp.]|nr:hypothetical protein [Methanobrevibacter sp.]
MVSTISLIISIVAVITSVGTLFAQNYGNKKSTNALFANLWIELDQIFIDHPDMHKYFYSHSTDINEVNPNPAPVVEKDYEQALCIAERIVDVFQYAELFKDSLSKKDKDSYEKFKLRMFSSEFMDQKVKPTWINNGSDWILNDNNKQNSIKKFLSLLSPP